MNFNYNCEIKKILDKIYEYKVNYLLEKQGFNETNFDKAKLVINTLSESNIYFGSDLDAFIKSLIPDGKEGYLFRCEIAKQKNHLYPKLYDYFGNPIKSNTSYTKFAMQLWEDNMDNLLLDDLGKNFNKLNFKIFIDKHIDILTKNAITQLNKKNDKKRIVIPFNKNGDLFSTIKYMVLNNKLDQSYIDLLVDMDKLRNDMIMNSAEFDIYSEFDKLEDDLEYCIDNFSKHTSEELYDILLTKIGFKYIDNLGLVKE